jgi:hypothetical protein
MAWTSGEAGPTLQLPLHQQAEHVPHCVADVIFRQPIVTQLLGKIRR